MSLALLLLETKACLHLVRAECARVQVMGLFHSPLSTLIKGIVVASEETLVEAMPIAWELLLEGDQQLAAVSGLLWVSDR